MKYISFALYVTISVCANQTAAAQSDHDHMKGMHMPMKHSEKMPSKSTLKPAEGASVKILSPTAGQVIKGDEVRLEFAVTKGKRGEHVHAYVDGEMVGMFKTTNGTLNGITPGKHTLVVRVATADHNTELDAEDRIEFVVE